MSDLFTQQSTMPELFKTGENISRGIEGANSRAKHSNRFTTIAIQQIIANSRRNGTSLHSPAE